MGIKLDWEIEAEQSEIRSAGEDKDAARRRRVARVRLLIFIGVVVVILGGVSGVILWRLQQVDAQIEQMLIDTVGAEVAALRIGDRNAFLLVQRSADEGWSNSQEDLFSNYQDLKQEDRIQLTGHVLSTEIDGTRGRVEVQEVIDGIPYAQLWFYWRYVDGWRHVPPDFEFWGTQDSIERERVTVHYYAVDGALAEAVAPRLDEWLTIGCAALECVELPAIEIDIVPDDLVQMGWAAENPWLLRVPSPYLGRARLDVPFSTELQVQIADLIAQRLVALGTNNLEISPSADAEFLRQAVTSWFVGRFAGVDTGSYFVDSLAQNYGEASIGRLLRGLQPTSDISVANQVIGAASLEQANLDWRDFMRWRLQTEQALINARDQANFAALYDTGDENALSIANGRFNANAPIEPVTVQAVSLEIDGNGVAHLRGLVRLGSPEATRDEEVILRLVNGAWRRAN